MKIEKVKINGIKNPVGFFYNQVKCSWTVEEFTSTIQKHVKIEVSLDESLENIVYIKEGKDLSSIGEVFEFTLQPRTTYFFRITVEGNKGESAVSEISYFETGKMDEAWTADWIGPTKEHEFHMEGKRKHSLWSKLNWIKRSWLRDSAYL
jgi:alpha-L-rhamnosidase